MGFINKHRWMFDYIKKFPDGRGLLWPGTTHFATNFTMLESIVRHKKALYEMLPSD